MPGSFDSPRHTTWANPLPSEDGKPLAIKLAKLDQGGGIVDEWYAMGKAKNVAEFKAAMKTVRHPNVQHHGGRFSRQHLLRIQRSCAEEILQIRLVQTC